MSKPDVTEKLASVNVSTSASGSADGAELKHVPFTITCPEIKPGQGVKTKEILAGVRMECGVEVLTAEAMDRIETIKMQMMLTRLVECVRELYENPPNVDISDRAGNGGRS